MLQRIASLFFTVTCSVVFVLHFFGMSYLMRSLQSFSFTHAAQLSAQAPPSLHWVMATTGSTKKSGVFLGRALEPSVGTKLEEWVRTNGGFIGPLKAKDGQYGRSVVATADILKDQLVIRIPMSIAITPSVYNTSMPRNFSEWRPDPSSLAEQWARHRQNLRAPANETSLNDWNRLALAAYVSAHAPSKHANASKFSLYFDSVPPPNSEIWAGMPRFWTQEHLALFNGSHVGETLQWDKERFEHLYGVAHEGLDWLTFQWGLAIVSSRAFSVSFSKGKRGSSVLLPWADLLNDDSENPHLLFSYNKEADAMDFVSRREVLKGEEVTTSYGPHSNLNLLRSYGFTNHEMPSSRYSPAARFTLTLADAAQLVDFGLPARVEKEAIVSSQTTTRPEFTFFQFVHQDQFYKLLRYARFLMLPTASKDELAKAGCQAEQSIVGCVSALERAHEERSLHLIRSFAHAKLASYPTTMEEDERVLAMELKPWKASSLRLLRDEKRPFMYIQQIVDRMLALQKDTTGVSPVHLDQSGVDCEKQFSLADGDVYWKCRMDKIVSQYTFGQK